MAMAVLAACGGGRALPLRAGQPDIAADAARGFAFAVQGGALFVSRPAAPLVYSDGLAAKRAALAHCAGQGARLAPDAYGRFAPPAWVFAGACL